MEKKTFIYVLIDPRTNQVRYVGKTDNIRKRYNHHLIYNGKSHKTSWIKNLKTNGCKPIIEVIDEVPLIDWKFWEVYWISQFKTWGFDLTNNTNGGEGFASGDLNPAHLPHVKNLRSKIHKGKVVTQKIRDKISKSLTGREKPEHSKFMTGRKQSEEQKKNKGLSLRGKNSKLTIEQVIKIKKLFKNNPDKLTLKEIGDLFGVKRDTIKNIKLKKTWDYIVI